MSLDKVANHRITRHGTIPDAFLARPCFTFCVTLSLTVIRYCYFDQKLVYNEASFSTFPRLSIVSLLLFFFFCFFVFLFLCFLFWGRFKKRGIRKWLCSKLCAQLTRQLMISCAWPFHPFIPSFFRHSISVHCYLLRLCYNHEGRIISGRYVTIIEATRNKSIWTLFATLDSCCRLS